MTSLKEKLQKIAEKSLLKKEFNQDVKDFAQYILHNWLKRVAIAADYGNYSLCLTAWTGKAQFNGVKVYNFLSQNLLEYIASETELVPKLETYMIGKTKQENIEIINAKQDFAEMYDDDEYKFIYLIKLTWE